MVQEVNRQDLGAFGSTLRLEAVPSTEGRSKRMTRSSLSLKLWVSHEGSAILLIMRLDKRFLVLQRLMFETYPLWTFVLMNEAQLKFVGISCEYVGIILYSWRPSPRIANERSFIRNQSGSLSVFP